MLASASAHANCNIIPGAVNQFRGALGTLDRPFAMPGDLVEVTLRRQVCDEASLGIADHDGNGTTDAADVVVTLLFEPPFGGPRSAVVLAPDCGAIASSLAACDAGITGAVACLKTLPNDVGLIRGAVDERIRFRFPDTDALVEGANDDRTLAGPATLAITAAGQPLLCAALAAGRCADTGGLIACVDEIYAIDGRCHTDASKLGSSFQHFTALPPPNDYEAVCDTPATPCDGTAGEVRLTTDVDGNALIPWDYRGVLVRLDDVPIPRLVRGSTTLEAFAGGALEAIRLPGSLLASFSPQGHRLPPIFTPLADPSDAQRATLFGSVDAPIGVMRLTRRGDALRQCTAGPNAGLPCNDSADCPSAACGGGACREGANAGSPCTADGECPGGECGAAAFELRDRYAADVGPVVIGRASYEVEAENPVPLDGLSQTDALFAFVRSEPIEVKDLNGDNDRLDRVVVLQDRETGVQHPIGARGFLGRAITQIRREVGSQPAIETSGDLVALLESVPRQSYQEQIAGGQPLDPDPVWQLYRLEAGTAQRIATPSPLVADADSQIGGRSGALSAGRFFFRTAESREAVPRNVPIVADPFFYFWVFEHHLSVSGDGQRMAYEFAGEVGHYYDSDVYVHDRQTGVDTLVSVDSSGSRGDAGSYDPTISADGRFVAFESVASNLVSDDTNGVADVFVHDLETGETTRVSVATDGTEGDASSSYLSGYEGGVAEFAPAISSNGRFVAFASFAELAPDLVPGWNVYVRDRLEGTTTRIASGIEVSISADGGAIAVADGYFSGLITVHDRGTGEVEVVGGGSSPRISGDGRRVVFASLGNLVPGDTNGAFDVFVYDRPTRRTVRVSVNSAGGQAIVPPCCGSLDYLPLLSESPSISYDGRWVAFDSFSQLDIRDLFNKALDTYVHDLVTGETSLVSGANGSGFSSGAFSAYSTWPSISGDGRVIGFAGHGLADEGPTGRVLYLHQGDPDDVAADRSGDGVLDDTVLRVVDVASGATATATDLCPADSVEVHEGRALFLRPEAAGPSAAAACPEPSADSNGDGDAADSVAHFWDGGVVQNLGLAATAVSLSTTHLAALASESQQGGVDFDLDGDAADAVLHLAAVAAPSAWTNTRLAAESLRLGETVAALISSETSDAQDRNGDGDAADSLLRLVDVATGAEIVLEDELGQPTPPRSAIELVLGNEILAFRASEEADAVDWNADGDQLDAVLHVVDLAGRRIVNTLAAAVPCAIDGCDPEVPYSVAGRTVTFLTLECQQGGTDTNGCPTGGTDLNGDGDAGDLVLQTFHPAVPAATAMASRAGAPAGLAAGTAGGTALPLASVDSGYCTVSGTACATDAECAPGVCYVPPGSCVRDLATACPSCPFGPATCCPAGQFCRENTCWRDEGRCKSDGDCTTGALCEDAAQTLQDVTAPLRAASLGSVGEQIFSSSGVCLETRDTPCAPSSTRGGCELGEFCLADSDDPTHGQCHREHGTCATDGDCPIGAPLVRCVREQLITAAGADVDGDGIADAIDDCPDHANGDQADLDRDGIGDACDQRTCGNGIAEGNPTAPGDEECDDGNGASGDGCSDRCRVEGSGCDDGIDDDGDGLVDLADPGCPFPFATLEDPACDDGLDNDEDGLVDFDDPACSSNWPYWETAPCGIGGELALVLIALRIRWRRRERDA